MNAHPVQLHVEAAPERARVHVVTRLLLLIALGTIGCSSVYWLLYLGLPALVAAAVTSNGAARYRAELAPRIVRGLRWLAGGYAYLWLLTDEPPAGEGARGVSLAVDLGEAPTPRTALLRLFYSVPAFVVLVVLSILAPLLWAIGALAILFTGRLPRFVSAYLLVMLRYQFRLITYHLSLVERYPQVAEDAAPEVADASAA